LTVRADQQRRPLIDPMPRGLSPANFLNSGLWSRAKKVTRRAIRFAFLEVGVGDDTASRPMVTN